MIITLNQQEIEKMILLGLTNMGIPHEGATITMVAGRSPTGISAEVSLAQAEIPVLAEGHYTEGPSGFSPGKAETIVTGTNEVVGSSNPEGAAAAIAEAKDKVPTVKAPKPKSKTDDKEKEPSDQVSLFED